MTTEPKIWLTTDWHLNHLSIVEKFGFRPTNFKDLIIEGYKEVVKPEDTVINLGDVIFKQAHDLWVILADLPGNKILVRGNHDKHKPDWYLHAGFNHVCYRYEYKNILFSHKPVDLSEYPNKYIKRNIHGHFHDNSHSSSEYSFYSKKHLCLSIEKENYKMITLDDFLMKYGE